ncbi:MAG: class I SAM-dependent methyltransferase [Deltaproteobacteria bacterium]|nr:class I SAM-dependent methyltransferase [Deltaproteobacteria bacterium]
MSIVNSLMVEPIRGVLQDLHSEARSDRLRFITLAPRILGGLARGRKLFDVMTPESMKECFIPVSPEQGEFLYLTARALGARTIVHERAVVHLERAGVADVVDVRLGDALETLREVSAPVDLVLLDGWKDLYLPVLDLLVPRLRAGSVVLADNIFTFRKSLRPYVDYVQSGEHGFASTTLQISDGFEYSVYLELEPATAFQPVGDHIV